MAGKAAAYERWEARQIAGSAGHCALAVSFSD